MCSTVTCMYSSLHEATSHSSGPACFWLEEFPQCKLPSSWPANRVQLWICSNGTRKILKRVHSVPWPTPSQYNYLYFCNYLYYRYCTGSLLCIILELISRQILERITAWWGIIKYKKFRSEELHQLYLYLAAFIHTSCTCTASLAHQTHWWLPTVY